MEELSLSDRLPNGIARKIAVEHLENQDDFDSFKQVCSTWRSETMDIKYISPSKNTQLPWLMLVDSPTTPYRRFYSLSKHKSCKINLPEFDEDADDNRRYLSSKGWLIAVSRNRAIIHFYNVLTCQLIKPPALDIHSVTKKDQGEVWYEESYLFKVSKFSFSLSPSSSDDDDFEVAMVFDVYKHIAFWRPGQQEWVKPVSALEMYQIDDVCFFQGQFYSIDQYSRVISYYGNHHTPKHARIVASFHDLPDKSLKYPDKSYIVPFQQSTLLVICRDGDSLENDPEKRYCTLFFELFEVNVDNGKVAQLEGIGDRALFVGYNSTFFVEASPSDPRGCRPNSIYFADDRYFTAIHPLGGLDMGIFCLEQKKAVHHQFYNGPSQYSFVSPPTWLQLPPY